MKSFMYGLCFFMMAQSASAAVMCSGKITKLYKWNGMTTMSVIITDASGVSSPWINMPSKSEESMAMMAFAADKPVGFYWNTASITSCADGAAGTWAHNIPFDGYFLVSKS